MQIRIADKDDAHNINAIYRPYVTGTCISFETEPPSDDHMSERITRTLQQFPWLVCTDGRKLLGYAYAGRYRERAAYQWAAETTVYVAQDNQRGGIGRALYQRLLGLLKDQGYFTVYAGITLPNPASVGFHEASGYEPVGVYRNAGFKFGVWHHVGWWQRMLQPPVPPPDAPTPFLRLAIREAGAAIAPHIIK